MSHTMSIISAFAILVAACSSSPQAPMPEEPASSKSQAIQASNGVAPIADAGTKAGVAYTHSMGQSKFQVGPGTSQVDFPLGYRIVGDEGVFSVFRSGYTMGIPNASAKVRVHGGPPSGGIPGHNQLVRDYFVGAGLPENQIRTIEAFPVMLAVQSDSPDVSANATSKLLYFDSLISRQISGIPVSDSFATARINEDGAVVSESAYWPEVSESVITDAKALAAALADATQSAAYRSLLPIADSRNGTVVIHHSSGLRANTFAAKAVFEVPDTKSEMAGPLHFDSKGARVTLP